MRLPLAISLILLILWILKTDDAPRGNPCEAVSMSETAASLILSPLSMYSLLISTLLRLILSVPSLVLGSIHRSLLLLLAWPWCIASICGSLFLTCVQVVLYLVHLTLMVGVMLILIVTQLKKADCVTSSRTMLYQQNLLGRRHADTSLRVFGRRVVQQGQNVKL